MLGAEAVTSDTGDSTSVGLSMSPAKTQPGSDRRPGHPDKRAPPPAGTQGGHRLSQWVIQVFNGTHGFGFPGALFKGQGLLHLTNVMPLP